MPIATGSPLFFAAYGGTLAFIGGEEAPFSFIDLGYAFWAFA
jgi:hypothetical protein